LIFKGIRWHGNGSYRVDNLLFIKADTMKKLIVVLLCMSMGAATIAQSGPGTESTKKAKDKTMKNLRGDVRAHEATKKVVGHDVSHLRLRQAVRDHKQVAQTHRTLNADSKIAKAQGINHPVTKAKRQVRVQDDNQKDHI
jgi:Ni/Co efflux regulator RcnB